MRLSFKKIVFGSLFCFLVVLLYFVINEYHFNKFTPQVFNAHDSTVKNRIHYSNYRYGRLDKLLTDDNLSDKSIEDKCNIFFKDLILQDYRFPVLQEQHYSKDIDKMGQYFSSASKKIDEQKNGKISKSDLRKIKLKFDREIENSVEMDQEMADSISIMRIYQRCYFDDSIKMKVKFDDITSRLFPYLTGIPPAYTIFTGNESTTFNNGIPEFVDGQFTGKALSGKSKNLIRNYHQNINGKGIVISAAPTHAKDIARLIRVLRGLNNQLPIQIVHRGNLSKKSMAIILESAVNEIEYDGQVRKQGLVDDVAKRLGVNFPPQTVFFTNIKQMVRGRKFFKTYNNKLLAMVFSSFEEVILLDADSVPLVEIEKFFLSKQYLETGTLFFKDRTLRDTNDYLETNMFQRLFPMNKDSLELHFGIPRIHKDTLRGNNYLRGYRHYQEAGVVVFNKRQHFNSLLMLLPLGIWMEPIKTAVWGDKEFYWISMLMAGDENLGFNEYEAASIGVASSPAMQIYDSDAHEVCSNHPGHLNEHGELLWINSGYSYCKKNNYYRDKNRYPFSKVDIEELKSLYDEPLKITHALVPPSLPNLREMGDDTNIKKEKKFKASWKKRLPDLDQIEDFHKLGPMSRKIDYPPQKGWVKHGMCAGYYYCAYDKINSYDETRDYDYGTFFTFNETAIDKFDFFSTIWSIYNPRNTNMFTIT